MEKQDRNTIILLLIVFIVCLVALIAVVTISWRIVGDSVNAIVGEVTRGVQLQSLDYNFPIPEPQ